MTSTQSECWIRSHVWYLAARSPINKGRHATVGVLCPRELERLAYIVQQMELPGRPIGTVYSWASLRPSILLHGYFQQHNGYSLVTNNQCGILIWHQSSKPSATIVSGSCSKVFGGIAFDRTFAWHSCMLLTTKGTVSSLCVYHELVVHIRLCSLCTVHSCTFSTMQWDCEMQHKVM